MSNETNTVVLVPQKRKYTRRNNVTCNSGGTIRHRGLSLTLDPSYLEELKQEQLKSKENQFNRDVLPKFENYLSKLKQTIQDSGEIPEKLEIPMTLETASVDFSSAAPTDRLLVPGNDYAVRIHVGLMTIMSWTSKEIASLQKQIVDLKSVTVEVSSSQETVQSV